MSCSPWLPRSCSVDQRDERIPFFDDVRRELCAAAGADVLRRMDRSGRYEQHVARFERHRRLALDLILERAFEDVDDLFAGMRVPRGGFSGRDLDDRLDGLASEDTQ